MTDGEKLTSASFTSTGMPDHATTTPTMAARPIPMAPALLAQNLCSDAIGVGLASLVCHPLSRALTPGLGDPESLDRVWIQLDAQARPRG